MFPLLALGLFRAAVYSLIAISFSLIYTTTRIFHFAHAIVFTSGAYCLYLFHGILELSLYTAIPLAIACTILLGCLIELSVYKPLRRKQTSSMIMLLASLGLYILLQNLISMLFGDDTKRIRTDLVTEGFLVFDARITFLQVVIIMTSIIVTILYLLFINETKMGKATKAVANDAELACISGISSNKVIMLSFAVGSGLAGIAGILVGLDLHLTPTMGMKSLMMGIVAMVIGGVISIPGIVCGAMLLAFAQNFGVWYIGSQWQDAIAFVILLVFLIFRPQGFFGRKTRKISV